MNTISVDPPKVDPLKVADNVNAKIEVKTLDSKEIELVIQEHRRKKLEPIDDTGYTEIAVAVVGSVDSGKSSLVGVLINPKILDDGNGLSRSIVFRHPHERASGRTSDISYQILKDEPSKRIFTFIDLAGHEVYLRTTISGLSSGYPDLALVCISDKITKMTVEHISLVISMGIPVLVAFTKIDIVPMDKTAELITILKKKLAMAKRTLFHIRKPGDLKIIEKNKLLLPFIMLSNKTGEGHDLIKEVLRYVDKKERKTIDGFAIEQIYNVPGHGTVVSGLVGQDVSKGDTLYLGPHRKGDFAEVKVKTLHNDYHKFVDKLEKGKRGCLCIKVPDNYKVWLRSGMILRHTIPTNICRRFVAKVKILHHHTTIKSKYQAFMNCGMIREPVQFLKVCDSKGVETSSLRTGDHATITLEFLKGMNYLEVGQILVFREGLTRGIGIVQELILN